MVGCHQSVPRRFENIRRRAPPHRFGGRDRKVYSSAIRCRWGNPSRVMGGVQRSMGRRPRRRGGRGHDLGHHGDRPVGPVVSEEGDFVPDRGLHQETTGERGWATDQWTLWVTHMVHWSMGPTNFGRIAGKSHPTGRARRFVLFRKIGPPKPRRRGGFSFEGDWL